jgi:hypothetical protein
MTELAKALKSKGTATPMAQSVGKELNRDQFSELDSSEAFANNIELDIDSEVVEPEPVTKKKKMKGDVMDKTKDKVPILNLRDEIRANREKIPNSGGRLKVEGHNCLIRIIVIACANQIACLGQHMW